MVVVLTHGAPVVSSVYASVSAVLSAGYAGQGKHQKICFTGVYSMWVFILNDDYGLPIRGW